jgi:transcriptional regulator with XRE-family HTH domain
MLRESSKAVCQTFDASGLKKQAGLWLRLKREQLGLSQRELARRVQIDYYTFISQIESGKGKVPADRLQIWAEALEVEPSAFAKKLMGYYDPHTYNMIFGGQKE